MSDDPKPRADHVPANTSDELSDELRPSEPEADLWGSFLEPTEGSKARAPGRLGAVKQPFVRTTCCRWKDGRSFEGERR